MVAYLLHKLPDAERDAFEERWMNDLELYQELQDAESELLDAYAAGTLPAEERELVEKYLLASAEQRRKLQFARSLLRAFPKPDRRPMWRELTAAAAILVLAGAGSWLAWQNASLKKRLAAPVVAPPTAAAVYVAEIASGGASRSAAAPLEVRLPAKIEVLRLDLQLEAGDEATPLAASVVSGGREIWQAQPIRAERHPYGFAAPVWIPAAQLTSGDYQVKLTTGGELLDTYSFRLQRQP